ncbi:MAG: amino acid adenylation domain-containing protein, partial [Pseudomonadota bacterium]
MSESRDAVQLNYWREKLSNSLPVLDMPLDFPRVPRHERLHEVETVSVPIALSDKLAAIGSSQQTTLSMTLLSAFFVLLYRYSRQTDICIGIPAESADVSDSMDTLILRAGLDDGPSFQTLLTSVRDDFLVSSEYQGLAFGQLLDVLPAHIHREQDSAFRAFFAYQDKQADHALPEWLSKNTLHTDLGLWLRLNGGALELKLSYDIQLFSKQTAQQWLKHYKALLESIVAAPTQSISELSLFSEDEYEYLVSTLNNTARDYPRTSSVHDLVSRQAAASPGQTSVEFGADSLSYEALEQRSNQLAQYLISQGTQPGDLIGICVNRSVEMLIGLLGILKTGAAYLPLDPEYPAERLAFIADDAELKTLLAETATINPGWTQHIKQIISLDNDLASIEAHPNILPDIPPNPERCAYVIYTSGSTGKPKGVQVPHRAVVNFLSSMAETPGIQSSDTLLAVTTLSFDIAVLELFLPLTVGARLVIASREAAADGHQLKHLLEDNQVTMMQATPATWRILLAANWQSNGPFRILCGGEAFPKDLLTPLCQQSNDIWNMYGPTETTIWSTCQQLHPDQTVSIGTPIANTFIYVLDELLKPSPIGAPGELYIGGEGVTHGYLNRPELTAERFVPNPFNDVPNAKMYKTGDLVCRRADGSLEYINRLDNQIKLRGFRIELGEIEAVLITHQYVAQCAVIVREDQPGDQRLTAYIVPDDNAELTMADMRQHLQQQLPDYMIPQHLQALEALPLTPNNKIDRNALRALVTEQLQADVAEFVAARNEREQLIVDIWQEVLGLARVGIEDNFFLLGGHSLLATQIISRLRDNLGVELSMSRLFEHPTISALADLPEASTLPAIQPAASAGTYPLSFSQQRLWFLDQLRNGSLAYHIPLGFRLSGLLDIERLQRSLQTILDRHGILRTVFHTESGLPAQSVSASTPLDLTVIEVLTNEQQELQRNIEAIVQQPFNLQAGPLFQAWLFRLNGDEYILLLLIHHIIFDGESSDILLRELTAAYQQIELPSVDLQYADFATWQQNESRDEKIEASLTYWQTQLADIPPLLELPADHSRPPVQSTQGSRVDFQFAATQVETVYRFSKSQNVTPFMLLLGVFAILLQRYSR